MVPGDFAVTIALMNHKDQRLTPGDIDLCHEIFGPGRLPNAPATAQCHLKMPE